MGFLGTFFRFQFWFFSRLLYCNLIFYHFFFDFKKRQRSIGLQWDPSNHHLSLPMNKGLWRWLKNWLWGKSNFHRYQPMIRCFRWVGFLNLRWYFLIGVSYRSTRSAASSLKRGQRWIWRGVPWYHDAPCERSYSATTLRAFSEVLCTYCEWGGRDVEISSHEWLRVVGLMSMASILPYEL